MKASRQILLLPAPQGFPCGSTADWCVAVCVCTAGIHHEGGRAVPACPGGVLSLQGGLQQAVPAADAASPHQPRRVQGLEPQHCPGALL